MLNLLLVDPHSGADRNGAPVTVLDVYYNVYVRAPRVRKKGASCICLGKKKESASEHHNNLLQPFP